MSLMNTTYMNTAVPMNDVVNADATLSTDTWNSFDSWTYAALARDPVAFAMLDASILSGGQKENGERWEKAIHAYSVQKHASLLHIGQFNLKSTPLSISTEGAMRLQQ